MLSVVVVPFGSVGGLWRCLEALVGQLERLPGAEVLVPHDEGTPWPERQLPGVRFLAHAGRRTPAELRALGAAASRGSVVAFLESHCLPVPGWCDALMTAHAAGHQVVGGPIEKGVPPGRRTDTALNWSVYLTDFGRYMPPVDAGPSVSLSDCNVSYGRSALRQTASLWSREFHENVVNDALHRSGCPLWLEPGMMVLEARELAVLEAFRDRFAFGRLYGSTRMAGRSPAARAFHATASMVLPPLVFWRVARTALDRRRHRAQVVRSGGWLLLLAAAWLVGEAVGSVTGRPGRSLTPGLSA